MKDDTLKNVGMFKIVCGIVLLGYALLGIARGTGFSEEREYYNGYSIFGYSILGVNLYFAPIIIGLGILLVGWMLDNLPANREDRSGNFPLGFLAFHGCMIPPILCFAFTANAYYGSDTVTTFLTLMSFILLVSPIKSDVELLVFLVYVGIAIVLSTICSGGAGPLYALCYLGVMYLFLRLRFLCSLLFFLVLGLALLNLNSRFERVEEE